MSYYTELTCELESVRRRFLMRRCKVVELTQTVFHGSPTWGLAAIHRTGMLRPQEHGELPDEWLSVSVNDNMLHLFSEGECMNGFASTPTLRCLLLDGFHHAVLCGEKVGDLHLRSSVGGDVWELWARRLGYCEKGDIRMTYADLHCCMPDGIDGLIFPGAVVEHGNYFVSDYNSEDEIALNERGCAKVWAGLDMLWHRDKEYEDMEEGWAAILHTHATSGTDEYGC